MGYHKQQQIASQVEVADRVPSPRSASSHVTLQVRRRELRKPSRDYSTTIVLGGMIALFIIGFVLGVMA